MEWKSVKKNGNPKEDGHYLCTLKVKNIFTGEYYKITAEMALIFSAWNFIDSCLADTNEEPIVTHWMPMLAPAED